MVNKVNADVTFYVIRNMLYPFDLILEKYTDVNFIFFLIYF